MRTLAYAPTVEVYLKGLRRDGDVRLMDLSPDVTECSVKLVVDGASTCTFRLANEGRKYDGKIEPMDAVAVFASKGSERNRLYTGYVTKVSDTGLGVGAVTVTTKDTLYRLQQLYWDSGLVPSQAIMGRSQSGWGFEDEMLHLLRDVGGVPESQIAISDQIPDDVLELARNLYVAQAEDVTEVSDMRAEFQDILMSFGASVAKQESMGSWTGETQGITGGETIEIPSSVPQSGVYTITPYQSFNWAYDQGKVFRKWKEQGSRFSDHIAVIEAGGSDRLLIACTTTFGWNGDMLDFYLEGGIVLRTIMADAKSAGDGNYTTWGHMTGGTTNVIEFEIDSAFWNSHHWNPGTNGWHEEWAGKRVVKVRNLGSIL